MSAKSLVTCLLLIILTLSLTAQPSAVFSGQVSSWVSATTGGELPLWGGGRYIPQLNIGTGEQGSRLDGEFSANIYGSLGFRPFDTAATAGGIKPYRLWVRYSTNQLEVRLGLQKLSFGSAMMLRPLMWFDRLDQRDPLQLTDGVWGVMTRYFFLNNANIWLWGLYGTHDPRGWEVVPGNKKIPELGGRVQFPVPAGEIAVTYHHRVADSRAMAGMVTPHEKIPENRIGLDTKWDLKAGLWFEGSYTHKGEDLGYLTNLLLVSAGMDYTFGIGNGLYAAFEQVLISHDSEPLAFSDPSTFSGLTVSYPIGLFDNLSMIIYCNWNDGDLYNFVRWHRQFNNTDLYLMAFWNPESLTLPAQTEAPEIFAGRGIQFMFVYNH
ncbi:MAG: hypothetical protein GX622_10085 [Bacteroidales bacterium]|nr:hypothetical protein [Bacteroidales bacterium]